jgi:hypothetical protein
MKFIKDMLRRSFSKRRRRRRMRPKMPNRVPKDAVCDPDIGQAARDAK